MTQGSPDPSADPELTLPEMLADPIVQMVMARDGVRKEDVESLFEAKRREAARVRSRCPRASRQELGATSGED